MQNTATPFSEKLKKALDPVYLMSGDEILLVNENADLIRQSAAVQGFHQRQVFIVERGFDWHDFKARSDTFNLFSEKTILELRNPNAKFDKIATDILIQYLANPPKDKLLLIITSKLTPAAKKTKWYKAISEKGTVLPIWPLNGSKLTQFIQTRLKKYQLNAGNDCIHLLAELTQGNLLATDQAIQKLKLTLGNEKVTPEAITKIVNDASRFTVFDWSRFLLLGQTKKALHCLEVLRLTGTEPTLLLWLLAREVRILHQYHQTKQFKNEWPLRQEQLKVAARRLHQNKLSQLLQELAQLDLIIKGLENGTIWTELEEVTVKLCQPH